MIRGIGLLLIAGVLGGCTFAQSETVDRRYTLAAVGGSVQQIGPDYVLASDQRQSFRDAVAGFVAYTITKAYQAVKTVDIEEGEATARRAIEGAVESDQIGADLARDLAAEETTRLLAE